MSILTTKIINEMEQLINQENNTAATITLEKDDDKALWLLGLSDALESSISIIQVFRVITGDRYSEDMVFEKGFDVLVLIALATKALTATFYRSSLSDKRDSIRFGGEVCGYLLVLSLCQQIGGDL